MAPPPKGWKESLSALVKQVKGGESRNPLACVPPFTMGRSIPPVTHTHTIIISCYYSSPMLLDRSHEV